MNKGAELTSVCVCSHRVLQVNQGLEFGLGGIQWELAGCLALAWLCVYGIIAKGLHSSGKIIWFTALFPYFVMFILLGRALTLEGAGAGLLYYVTPKWEKLFEGQTWIGEPVTWVYLDINYRDLGRRSHANLLRLQRGHGRAPCPRLLQ